MYPKFLLIIISFLLIGSIKSQSWINIDAEVIEPKGQVDLTPNKYIIYQVNDSELKNLLWSAPLESNTNIHQSNLIIEIGMPNLTIEQFKVVQYDMMEPELAVKYSDIRTYYGISTVNSLKRIRIDYTIHGFRAVISTPGDDKVFIDHYQRNDKNTRVVYYKKDYKKTPTWGCSVDNDINPDRNTTNTGIRIGDCQLRSYRLAQATTGEYSTFHGGTPTSVMSAVVTAINRVNEVYEAEIAVRLILVANTDQIFFYNASTDPYTNTSSDLNANQTTCNNIIGSSNYDIGHLFGTGGGGVAQLSSVCSNSGKARGLTGSSSPVGDPFTIDYVAHEMGHQFGGNHTQYNNCNRVSSAAMEPGSASTIMGYAGICSPNVQSNSDAYFHAKSLDEIKTFLLANGNNCATIVNLPTNNLPTISAVSNYSIPVSTPFVLSLNATDPNSHPMTYAWEQMNAYSNPAQTMPPASTNISGPVFRSIFATTEPVRYFPPLANVINNSTNTWQVLPSVARSMSFRGVVRDFTGTFGCNNEVNITVSTVNAAAGAFSVTSFNAATTWLEGDSKTLTWNVAGTTASPVNAANVDILLSYDGGNTYPVTIVAATPNDGSHTFVVPPGLTTQGRIMVKGSNHIFFDINNANITINPGSSSYELSANPSSFSVCNGTNVSSTISVQQIGSFNQPVTLSVSGLPPGASAAFSVNPVNPGNSTLLTFNGLNLTGIYTVSVNGIGGALNKSVPIQIDVLPNGNLVNLSTPLNMATNISLTPTLTWSSTSGSLSYDVQFAYDNNFTNLIYNNNTTSTSFQITNLLYGGTNYYWKVRSINSCGPGDWSNIRSFTTENCWFYHPNDLPLTIPFGNTNSISSNMNISDRGTVYDVNILNLSGSFQGGISNLNFSLYNPQNTFSLFWDSPCTKEALFDIQFDDSAANMNWPCPPNNGQFYMPTNPLNTLNGQELKGVWSLKLNRTDPNAGTLNNWTAKVCANNICQLTVQHDRINGPGSLLAAINCALDGDTIRIDQSIINDTFDLGNQNLVINKRIVLECDLTRNIHIISNSTSPTIENSTSILGVGTKIKGFHIHSSNSGIGAVNNTGKLTLEDVILYKWNGTSTSTISNQSGAITDLIGNCQIIPQ